MRSVQGSIHGESRVSHAPCEELYFTREIVEEINNTRNEEVRIDDPVFAAQWAYKLISNSKFNERC